MAKLDALLEQTPEVLENSFSGYGALRPYSVFCPPDPLQQKVDRSLSRKVYRWALQKHQSLFLADSEESLQYGALPGTQTFLNPDHAHFSAYLLRHAAAVLSFRIAPVLFARSFGIPSVLISKSNEVRKQAASHGIPVLSQLDELAEHLTPTLFSPVLPNKTFPPYDPRSGLTLCLISDWQYATQLVGFIENLCRVEKTPPRLFILCFQKSLQTFLETRFPGMDLNFVGFTQLWKASERACLRDLPLAKQAYASKSRLLEHVLASTDGPIFYCDVDLYFFEALSDLRQEFDDKNVLLFPHWNDSLRDMHRFGMFNAGLLGVRPGAENFLQWWAARCLESRLPDQRDDFYVDQGFLDLVPLYFDPAIYKGQRHNIGPWCLRSLDIEKSGGVASYHASQPDPFGFFEIKALWDQLSCLIGEEPPQMHQALKQSVYVQQAQHWPVLNRLYRFTHYVPYRFGFAPFWPSARTQRSFSQGMLKGLLLALTRRKTFFARKWRADDWIHWQSKYLRGQKPLTGRLKQSLMSARTHYKRLLPITES